MAMPLQAPPRQARTGRGRDGDRRGRHHPDAGHAAPGVAPRQLPRAQHHRRARRPDDDVLHREAAGVLQLSVDVAPRDAVPALAQRLGHPADPGHRSGGIGDRGVRDVRHRRKLPGRYRRFPHPGGHPVRGDHLGRRARRRGRGSIHPRRHARQADGDRRRAELRRDRRGHRPRPPLGSGAGSRLLRSHGRREQVRERRRHRRRRDDRRQHRRRPRGRYSPARHGHHGGAPELHDSDGRRGHRHPDSRPSDLGVERPPGDAHRRKDDPRRGARRAATRQAAGALHRGGSGRGDEPGARPAEARVL